MDDDLTIAYMTGVEAGKDAAKAEIERLRAQLAEATRYAETLAVSIHSKHYAEVTQWKPLPDVLGILTQIDNMTSGLGAQLAERDRDAERYRWLRDVGDNTWTPLMKRGPAFAVNMDAAIDAAMAPKP